MAVFSTKTQRLALTLVMLMTPFCVQMFIDKFQLLD